jgi:hypothetical protein
MGTHPERPGLGLSEKRILTGTRALLMMTHLVAAAGGAWTYLRASAPSRALTMSSTRSLASPKSIWLFSL